MVAHTENFEVNGLYLNNGKALTIPIFSRNSLLFYAYFQPASVKWIDKVWCYSQSQDLRILCKPLFMFPTCCCHICLYLTLCQRHNQAPYKAVELNLTFRS
jgi:hypothetical protein